MLAKTIPSSICGLLAQLSALSQGRPPSGNGLGSSWVVWVAVPGEELGGGGKVGDTHIQGYLFFTPIAELSDWYLLTKLKCPIGIY